MDDEEKTKTSFSLGENLSPRDTLAVQSTVPVLEELKQISIQKVKDFFGQHDQIIYDHADQRADVAAVLAEVQILHNIFEYALTVHV